MNLSSTSGGGRGGDDGEIVGSVILHGKKKYWQRGGSYHYHHGMSAGENTLDGLVTDVLLQSMVKSKKLDLEEYRSAYISFMTTPDTHNDKYAGTCHRMFFQKWSKGVDPKKCPSNDGHNVDAIDAIMVVPAVSLAMLTSSREERRKALYDVIHVTRDERETLDYADIYSEMLISIIVDNKSVREAALVASNAMKYNVEADVKRSRSDPMTACYITSSFPALLFYAYKYGEDGNGEKMLLASTNAGGENVGRTALLGALVGARVGYNAYPLHLRDELLHAKELKEKITTFASIFNNIPSPSSSYTTKSEL